MQIGHMDRRLRWLASVVAVVVTFVFVFVFAIGVVGSREDSAYDFGQERIVSGESFIDAAPPGWSGVRTRVAPPGGGPVFISSVALPDPCREVGRSITCDRLPPIVLPPGGVVIRIDTARDLLGPTSLVTPPPLGDELVVNGYRTKLVRDPGGECAAIGADETGTIVVPTLGDWIGRTTVVACLRGPDLAELENELLALIARATP